LGGSYVLTDLIDCLDDYGFEIRLVSVDDDKIRVRVRRTREPTAAELQEIDPDHYLIKTDDDLIETVTGGATDDEDPEIVTDGGQSMEDEPTCTDGGQTGGVSANAVDAALQLPEDQRDGRLEPFVRLFRQTVAMRTVLADAEDEVGELTCESTARQMDMMLGTLERSIRTFVRTERAEAVTETMAPTHPPDDYQPTGCELCLTDTEDAPSPYVAKYDGEWIGVCSYHAKGLESGSWDPGEMYPVRRVDGGEQ